MQNTPTHLANKQFYSRFVSAFPNSAEQISEQDLQMPQQTPGVIQSPAAPEKLKNPQLLCYSKKKSTSLGLTTPFSQEDIAILAGKTTGHGSLPYANCYGGHQFGHWAGQLGDGRAIHLGELRSSDGELIELQLKGAGKTMYSRNADGKAVLRSSIREYLMSEFMQALGIPTTGVLSLILSGEKVLRDKFYDGNPEYEPGAILCRTAPSFLRFGSFEILAHRGDKKLLRDLVRYSIGNFFPTIDSEKPSYLADFLREQISYTLRLMVEWMRVGFTHGVMNTDNMSILGLTIDYGPYGMLDLFDPNFTPNTTDLPGRRYAFGRQPLIAQWNLLRLAEALTVIDKGNVIDFEQLFDDYQSNFQRAFSSMIFQKLGLCSNLSEISKQLAFVEKLCQNLSENKVDYTTFFDQLTNFRISDGINESNNKQTDFTLFAKQLPEICSYREDKAFSEDFMQQLLEIGRMYQSIDNKDPQLVKSMNQSNPVFNLRNHHLHEIATQADTGDYHGLHETLEILEAPYDRDSNPNRANHLLVQKLSKKCPQWAFDTPGSSQLSCSS